MEAIDFIRNAFSAPEMERPYSPYFVDDEYLFEEANLVDPDANILSLDYNRSGSSSRQEDYELDRGLTGDSLSLNADKRIKNAENMENTAASMSGILDDERIFQGLSNLARSANGQHQVYLHVTLPGLKLKDICALEKFYQLQKVELPYNDLEDLSSLSHLPYLLILDASHNSISKVLDFIPPQNLREVDLSFNNITEMADLSAHHSLTKLTLDNNTITEIVGLERCKRLEHLSLAHNKIKVIQGLDNLPVKYLNLRCNELSKIENLETLHYLQQLHLSGNKIRSLGGLEDHKLLACIDLEDNEVIDIVQMKHICDLPMLRELNLLRNPIQELPDYRLSILFRLQRLTELDRHKVDAEEKVCSMNTFNPPLEVVAARDHVMHTVYGFFQPAKVWDSTLPSLETPYPMLVLVGPEGSGKKDLSMKLVEEFPDYFGYGISHTTRRPYSEEAPNKDYHYISLDKFEMNVRMGQFIQSYQYLAHWYGLQIESVESVAREGLACVVHMELEGVLSLKNTYFEPRYVLILPMNSDAQEKLLRQRGSYTESQIQHSVMRTDMYTRYNQEHPGFFDMVINSEDIQEAYHRLRRLIMDYLGINVPTPAISEAGEAEKLEVTASQIAGQNGSLPQGPRTWSRPSLADSLSHSHTRGGKAPSPSISGRGIVEEESRRRRVSAAKDAVTGYIPPLYDQILIQYPKTAPHGGHDQDAEDRSRQDVRSHSVPTNTMLDNMDLLPPNSPDSSSDDSKESDHLSNLSSPSARELGTPIDDDDDDDDELENEKTDSMPNLPSETVDPMELLSVGSGAIAPPPTYRIQQDVVGPRTPSVNSNGHVSSELGSPHSSHVSRPGSTRHRILPPISSSPHSIEGQ